MRDAKKRANSDVGHHVADSAKSAIKDAQSDKLMKTAKSVGNSEIQQRIQSGNASRDELLAFISARLGTIRGAQLAEMAQLDHQRDWWKSVSDSHKTDKTKPDPTQWGECARVYEEAANALARGALGRGKQLMERALDVEQKKFGDLSKVVEQKGLDKEASMPDAARDIADSQGCGDGEVPADIQRLSHEIQAVTTEFKDPMVKKRQTDPWWTLEEEEEEEEGGGLA